MDCSIDQLLKLVRFKDLHKSGLEDLRTRKMPYVGAWIDLSVIGERSTVKIGRAHV